MIFLFFTLFFTFIFFHFKSYSFSVSAEQFKKKTEKRKITSTYGLFFRRKPPVGLPYCNKMTYTV